MSLMVDTRVRGYDKKESGYDTERVSLRAEGVAIWVVGRDGYGLFT